MAINQHVSDLFFGLDFEDAMNWNDGPYGQTFDGYDLDRIKQLASWFCEALEGAGGPRVDADELVQSFYERL